MKESGHPVIFDATHSVQLPGGQGTSSGGDRAMILTLAKAAVAAGCDGLFLETYIDPDKALCDGPSALPLDKLRPFLEQVQAVDTLVKGLPALNID